MAVRGRWSWARWRVRSSRSTSRRRPGCTSRAATPSMAWRRRTGGRTRSTRRRSIILWLLIEPAREVAQVRQRRVDRHLEPALRQVDHDPLHDLIHYVSFFVIRQPRVEAAHDFATLTGRGAVLLGANEAIGESR